MALPDETIERLRMQAVRRLDIAEWGNVYEDAVTLLTAHLCVRAERAQNASLQGASGAIASLSAGGLSLSFGSLPSAMNDAELMTTVPGAAFVELRNSHCMGARIV